MGITLAFTMATTTLSAQTQTTVVTTGATTATVPLFGATSGSTTTVSNSPITVNVPFSSVSSNVAINAQNGQTSTVDLDVFSNIGDLQIEYTNPVYGFEINNTQVSGWTRELSFASNGSKLASFGASAATTSAGGTLYYLYLNANQGGALTGGSSPTMVLLPSGNVGIGTTSPTYSLDVAGKIRSSAGGVVYPDGTTQTTAWTGVVCGGDYAESVDVTGDRRSFSPGDVLVIDPNAPGKFLKSAEPYSTSVSGIYSTKPGTVGRRQKTPFSADEVPMAMMGIVPVNATAENGSIRPGDLLVTSSTIGFAMKGTDRAKMVGAVVGKALGYLQSGTGIIEAVVTLQ